MTPDEVIAGVAAGDPRAIARAITLVEGLGDEGRRVTAALHRRTGRARRVGITGPPGAGKSTLAGALVRRARAEGLGVAVVAVDPTSPYTRGAVLGDRIRLADLALDPGVFIRSMASRGHAGGLAEATSDAVLVLDAAGFDLVLVETVGAGQGEVEVRALTETVVLAVMPGGGDAVQAMKAGLMEIPDLIAVTKADRPGADALAGELAAVLSLAPAEAWDPPVVRARALEEGGVDEVWDGLARHRAFLAEGDRLELRRREGLRRQLCALAGERAARRVAERSDPGVVDRLVDEVLARRLDPSAAVDRLIDRASPAG